MTKLILKIKNQKTENLTKYKLSVYMRKLQNKISKPKPTSKIAQKYSKKKIENAESQKTKRVTT